MGGTEGVVQRSDTHDRSSTDPTRRPLKRFGMIEDCGWRREQPEAQGGEFDFDRLKLRSRFVFK